MSGQTPEQRLSSLRSSTSGLSSAEAKDRLLEVGPNIPARARSAGRPAQLLANFTHTLALLLWLAAGLAFAAGAPELGAAIVGVITLNGLFAFVQEYRAEQVIENLLHHVAQRATVIRDGIEQRLLASELVPGDVIRLAPEDIVPADCILLEDNAFSLDLSLLTGESMPVPRAAETTEVPPSAGLATMPPVAPGGAAVVTGTALGLVFASGGASSVGEIAHLVGTIERGESNLERQVSGLSRTTAAIAVLAGVITLILAQFTTSLGFLAALTFSTGVIVALVPEGLLPTLSVSLAIGARRMAGRGAAVRRLSAVEIVGSATVICTDKTGTLTRNELTVTDYSPSDARSQTLQEALECAILCSDARFADERFEGDPVEVALARWAVEQGADPEGLRGRYPRLEEIPFDARRRYMAVTCRFPDGPRRFAKGAPEAIAHLAGLAEPPTELAASIEAAASRGERLLMLAAGNAADPLRILGVVSVHDPPRPEVPEAIAACRRAGIKVVMLTGDHPTTATSIARQVGLRDFTVTGGDALAGMTDADALAQMSGDAVFARADPEQKLRIVTLLRRSGETVVVTGDGINDAPALRAADVGVAMGLRGTDVAKQAADIVLSDDNFATIVAAIEEGRSIKENIRRFVSYHFTSNMAELVPFVLYIFLPIPLPLAIIQVLAIDLGTDLLPAMALGAEPPAPGTMRRVPEPFASPLLTRSLGLRTFGFFGLLEALLGLGGYFGYWLAGGWRPFDSMLRSGPAFEREAATLTFLAIVGGQVGCLFAARNGPLRSRLSLRTNRLVSYGLGFELSLAVGLVFVPGLNRVFSMAAVEPYWLLVLPAAAAVFIAADGARRSLARVRRPAAQAV